MEFIKDILGDELYLQIVSKINEHNGAEANKDNHAVNEYLDGKASMQSIANKLGIDFNSLKQWVNNYEAIGTDAFHTPTNKRYSKVEKEQAVNAYLAGEGSYMDICKRFKIRSTKQLRSWVKKYNSHEELKASRTGMVKVF